MSRYPQQLDADDNLFVVRDSLHLKLAEDYSPGDADIVLSGSAADFPPAGIITLTEQCSDVDVRALCLRYTARSGNVISGLTVEPGFTPVVKPRGITHVTMNVVAPHHNELKDGLLAIEAFAGRRGEVATAPQAGTMEARINFLRKLVLRPKAWFSANKTVGVAPLTVTFQDLSLRAPTRYEWDFGDDNTQVLTFPLVPGQAEGTDPAGLPDGSVTHTYSTPGAYDVTLTVTNAFGTDAVVLHSYVSARTAAPDAATIDFNPLPSQSLSGGVLRTRVNTPAQVVVDDSGEQPMDAVAAYTWGLADDLSHPSLPQTEAQYSVGGIYDVRLRVDTNLGAFRITNFPGAIDVVERENLWLTVFDPEATPTDVTQSASTYEFGILSETWKVRTNAALSVSRDASFLAGQPSEARQKREFLRNNGVTPRGTVPSGDGGSAVLYWASGAANFTATQEVKFAEYNGFDDTYAAPTATLVRPWNWVSLAAPRTVYFLFGARTGTPSDLTNTSLADVDLSTYVSGSQLVQGGDFKNGADELLTNVGDGSDGEFSVYRSCWRDGTGFVLRNDGTGTFFRLKSFYRTEGIFGDPVRLFRKMPDPPGATLLEGRLVALDGGVYFFNNTGEMAFYDPNANLWTPGGPGVGSPAFTTVQDTSVTGYDSPQNTLVAAGIGHTAYLSFDYSPAAVMKFSEIDMTFTRLPARPEGEQFGAVAF